MKLSSKTHYGLKICYLLSLAAQPCLSASALEKEIGVSSKYIEKIMRILSKRDIIKAARGSAGGYFLARRPAQITVGEVVRALEDDFEFAPCVTLPCDKCASSSVWKKLYEGINAVLDAITLESMADGFNSAECGSDCKSSRQTEKKQR